ncbi:acetoacetate decarboxylase [Nocardioides marinisabuli]|uniref:Acetoacetate decarboxylase n=1 Tax=Nocardioides marinisabuli TaxID=419476 RepID=A0A7Y9F4U1_9ACTN|nr:acetoacetate decarboxylase family protein [Nocardioides marinisabuli]NYD59669.1 acetoacetate decarboxylase [Nocardioides marinisabuli]
MSTDSPSSPAPDSPAAAYPPAPWRMVGQMWVSVFRVADDVDAAHPRGIYGAAFVSYEEGSPLTYSELLVARVLRTPAGDRRVSITDIWVDSPASVAGGRGLWAIPKGLGDFESSTSRRGPLERARWSMSTDGAPVASARFSDLSAIAPRLPARGGVWQAPIDAHTVPVETDMVGRSRLAPGTSSWTFDTAGPLGWLAGRRSLASFRQRDFTLSFG